MNELWSDCIRSLEPYTPGEQPSIAGLIKLNTNENPYPPSPAVLSALQSMINADLRLYPDPEGCNLCITKRKFALDGSTLKPMSISCIVSHSRLFTTC